MNIKSIPYSPTRLYLSLVIVLFNIGSAFSQARLNYEGWILRNSYDFNYPTIQALQQDFFIENQVQNPGGNTEIQARMCSNGSEPVYYRNSTQNILTNTPSLGFLTIRAIKDNTTPLPVYNCATDQPVASVQPLYSSALIRTIAEPFPDNFNGIHSSGWQYGLFEIRCKIPNANRAFPAFWMYNGPYEVDIFEFEKNEFGNFLTTNLHEWRNPDNALTTPTINSVSPTSMLFVRNTIANNISCQKRTNPVDWNTFFNDFHTFSLTWEPINNPTTQYRTSFYIDGIEVRTDTILRFEPARNLSLWLNLSVVQTAGGDPQTIDYIIDYARVYQRTNVNDYLNTMNMYDFGATSTLVSNTNPVTQTDGIKRGNGVTFYAPTGSPAGRIIRLSRSGGAWTQSTIQTPSGNSLLSGPFAVGATNNIYYRGADGRMQTMYITSGTNYAHGYIDDFFSTNEYKMASVCNPMVRNNNDVIFYRGSDDKMHIFYWDAGVSDWRHRYPGGTASYPPLSENVDGDIVISGQNLVYYRGTDGKIHLYYPSGNNWTHTVLAANANYQVSLGCGALNVATWTQGGTIDQVFFRNSQGAMQSLIFRNNQWELFSLPFVANSNWEVALGGDISIGLNNRVYYRGLDGTIQMYFSNNAVSDQTWYHYWVNETEATSLPNSEKVHTNGSIEWSTVGTENYLIFASIDGQIRCFNYFETNGDPTRRNILGCHLLHVNIMNIRLK
jgi:hypothetical protein